MNSEPLRIGTRGSPMALAQAHLVRDRLAQADPGLGAEGAVEIVVINTTADRFLDRTLDSLGGKGLFTKEIEDALLERRVDLAVHSMKDVPTWLPDGLEIPCVLPRDDPRDAFLSPKAHTLHELPPGALVGTASLRRRAQLLRLRPDLRVEPLRGNANTRMRKLADGACDATFLALCGLERLSMADRATSIVPVEEILPAVAQGAVGVECRAGDTDTRARLAPLHCARTATRLAAERALLRVLDGSCKTPIAALADLDGGTLALTGLVALPDGSAMHTIRREGPAADAERIGEEAGAALRERAGAAFFEALRAWSGATTGPPV